MEHVAINDPKYLGVPNICFSLIASEDEREPAYAQQRLQYGFDDSETWDLQSTIAKFIIPRLERYIAIADTAIVRDMDTIEKTDMFLEAMKLVVADAQDGVILSSEDRERLKKGLEAFPQIFEGLWW